jgi:hypothetical protein
VPSRVLIGAGAWLLGALTATGGSLLAVDQLVQGLLEQHTKQVSVAMVNAELALENSERRSAAPAASRSPGASPAAAPQKSRARPRATANRAKNPAPPPTRDTGKLLTSAGGTAVATCENGRARLLYWSPGQGFTVFRVDAGPSSVASVTFTDSSGGVVMHVACGTAGIPAAHTSTFQWGGGGSHHDE